MDFAELLSAVMVPGEDNGTEFTDKTRIEAVMRCLDGTPYRPLRAEGVAYLLAHQAYTPQCGTVLISCHVDHCYSRHFWTANEDGTYRGTFDNAVTLAVLLQQMRLGTLHPQTLVAFTGDEEEDGRGAREAITCLRRRQIDPELIIVLDVTCEGYGTAHYTLENLFENADPPAQAKLRFACAGEFQQFLYGMLGETAYTVIDAEPDEAWTYDEYDVNCFTLCLPSLCPTDMHSDTGFYIRQSSIAPYAQALVDLSRHVGSELCLNI